MVAPFPTVAEMLVEVAALTDLIYPAFSVSAALLPDLARAAAEVTTPEARLSIVRWIRLASSKLPAIGGQVAADLSARIERVELGRLFFFEGRDPDRERVAAAGAWSSARRSIFAADPDGFLRGYEREECMLAEYIAPGSGVDEARRILADRETF